MIRATTMGPALSCTGRIEDLTDHGRRRLIDRGRRTDPEFAKDTAVIIDDVRTHGDHALRDLAARLDGVELDSLEVPRAAWTAALAQLEPAVRQTLEDAAAAIATFHRAQRPDPIIVETWPGVRLTRLAQPLTRVGVYVPGGRANYPSSVLMGVVPARVAGVSEVIVCSPPGRNRLPAANVLAACALAGADRVFAIGGAGAIAALAFGTETIPRVDRVVGPGNAWVAEAKRQLNGAVGIDCPAGPSELLIVADASADVHTIAAEIIAQTEHDPDAAAVLITTHPAHVAEVHRILGLFLESQPRRTVIEASLARHGALLVARDLDAALGFSNEYAAEHVLLLVAEPRVASACVKNAGTVFLGPHSSVTFGDYVTGANHVLPTGGTSRAFAGLSTLDFVRWVTHQEVSEQGAALLAPRAAVLADAEGLPGHAAAARLRLPVEWAVSAIVPPADSQRNASGQVHPRSARGRDDDSSQHVLRFEPLPLRPDYAQLRTYDPGRVPCDIDLSDNTNLWGPSQPVLDAIARIDNARITRYPSVYADHLRRVFAHAIGVGADNVTTGCGSDDVIDSTLRAFWTTSGRIAHPTPTFGMVPTFARMNGLEAIAVPIQADLELDVDAILATRADITYLCRPNNPTGTLFRRKDVERLVLAAHGLVIIDEAYVDFSGDDLSAFAIESGRAIVLRTLSKVYGLAGLRVGFAVGPARVITEIEKSRGPYKVSAFAEAAATAALTAGRADAHTTVALTIQNRERLAEALAAAGHRALPSAANFLLVPLPQDLAAHDAADALLERGIAVRPFAALRLTRMPDPRTGPGNETDWLRVTVGPWPMIERFLDAFERVLDAPAASRAQGRAP